MLSDSGVCGHVVCYLSQADGADGDSDTRHYRIRNFSRIRSQETLQGSSGTGLVIWIQDRLWKFKMPFIQ